MIEYPKIQSIFKRNMDGDKKLIEGKYSLPEFEYLKNNRWIFTEKIDGTNIRIMWDGFKVTIAGRTEKAEIPTFLYNKLQELFPNEKMKHFYQEEPLCIYGEGYGAKIQKGGGNYISNGVNFILFDVLIKNWWLKREDIEDISKILDIPIVPIIGTGTLEYAIKMIKKGIKSTFGDFLAEGIVLKPKIELKNRAGRRIITKLKHRDFK